MGAVICDASFQPRSRYEATIRPRILALQTAWPDAATVQGFQARLATNDLAAAMNYRDARKVAKAHAITRLLAAHNVDTRHDLHTWLDVQANRAALRALKDVGPKTVDYIGNLVGRSQIAVDVHLETAPPVYSGSTGLVALFGPYFSPSLKPQVSRPLAIAVRDSRD
ncbi:hypothetical protein [Streptomyces sp. NPDC060022]|uniref:hypothetical protein n=1 Tax=Streptomyces sp. NPDC060022 TaxID=3347039 RepID=UPI0036CB3159